MLLWFATKRAALTASLWENLCLHYITVITEANFQKPSQIRKAKLLLSMSI